MLEQNKTHYSVIRLTVNPEMREICVRKRNNPSRAIALCEMEGWGGGGLAAVAVATRAACAHQGTMKGGGLCRPHAPVRACEPCARMGVPCRCGRKHKTTDEAGGKLICGKTSKNPGANNSGG